jgi:peptidoglycan/xylan/chitin deacetylase (PgdA/CDA1 family)
VDRVFIERFLAEHAADIRGAVLEVQEDDLTRLFGAGRVTRADVVDIEPSNPRATIVADLRRAPAIPPASYDCILLTQTLHVIDDMSAVLAECRRILRPGGVLLATLPTASRVCLEYGENGDFWRTTEAGARSLFAGVFGADAIETRAYGNVLATAAFLYGLGSHELSAAEYDAFDPFFPTLVGVRAVRPAGASARRERETLAGATILLYHRVADDPIDVHSLAVPRAEFDAQMRVLATDFAPLALDELLARAAEQRLPPRAVAVTFDDGYVDNLTEAGPVLHRYGVPAAFFITSRPFDAEAREFWWDQLERVFFGTERLPSSLIVSTVFGDSYLARDLGVADLRTTARTEREHAHWALHRSLVRSDRETRDRAMDAISRWAGAAGVDRGSSKRPMSRDELRELIATPRRLVGAHGVDHLFLPSQGPAARRAELEESRAAIARTVGRDVRYFAYPYGGVDDETAAAAAAAGYAGALTCEARHVARGDDRMRLPRIEVRAGASLRELLTEPPPSASARAPASPGRSGA